MKNLSIMFLLCLLQAAVQAQIPDHASGEQRMALVTLKLSSSENTTRVSFIQATKVIAYDKKAGGKFSMRKPGDFICLVLDADKRPLDTLLINQPLKVRYEYPLDDKGTIGSTFVDIPENEILLRFNYTSKMKYLRVMEVLNGSEMKPVDTLILPAE